MIKYFQDTIHSIYGISKKKKKNDRRTRRDKHGAKVKVRTKVERIRDTKDEKSCMYIILQEEDDLEIL